MRNSVKGFFIAIMIIAGIGVLVYYAVRTVPENKTSVVEYLPREAQIVEDLGNNWFVFQIGERKFLYHRERAGYHLSECLTELQQ